MAKIQIDSVHFRTAVRMPGGAEATFARAQHYDMQLHEERRLVVVRKDKQRPVFVPLENIACWSVCEPLVPANDKAA